MNWLKENEMTPRRRPPVGHGAQAIARIQPVVPDLSVFIPPRNENDSFDVQPLNEINDENPNSQSRNPHKLSFGSEFPREPLAPINKNYCDINKPLPLNKEAPKSDLKAPKSVSSAPNLTSMNKDAFQVPDELMKVISWQNDQIVKLQEQLMALQRRDEEKLNDSKIANRCESSTQTSFLSLSSEEQHSKQDVSVQICSPSNPDRENLRQNLETSKSLVLGDSASIYQRSNVFQDIDEEVDPEECDKMLAKMANTSLRDEVDEPKLESSWRSPQEEQVGRFRQMGISFIKPDDLLPSSGQDKGSEFESYYPLHIPKRLADSKSTSSTLTDSSLAMNSAALKYLDDKMLTEMAKSSPSSKECKGSSMVTQYGISENQLSVATRNFLKSNRFATKQPEDEFSDENTFHQLTERLRFPKQY